MTDMFVLMIKTAVNIGVALATVFSCYFNSAFKDEKLVNSSVSFTLSRPAG